MVSATRSRIKELRYVKASELAPDPRNPRRHPATQRAALQAMLADVGIADAVIARETPDGLMLIDGHLRAGLDPDQMLPVLVTDLDETEAGKVLATLDPLAAMADVDGDALARLIADAAPPIDLKAMFPDVDIAGILASEPLTDPDAVPEPSAEPVSKWGDVWLLGRHRIMCGDSGDLADVAKLLDGAAPRLMVTDPPYGVNYDPAWRKAEGFSNPAQRKDLVTHDDTTDWSPALRAYAPDVCYVWSPSGGYLLDFGRILQEADYEIRAQLIWRKQQIVISRGHYHRQHEPCFYAVRKGATAAWKGDRKQSTVWDIPNLLKAIRDDSTNPNARQELVAQKPVECMERPIRNHEGDVYDPFVGSGTTIIAAERQDRTCYAMEIAPQYVDAAVKRWEDYTGAKAALA